LLTYFVFRSCPRAIETKYNALVSNRIKIINTRFYFGIFFVAQLFIIGSEPKVYILIAVIFAYAVSYRYKSLRVRMFYIST